MSSTHCADASPEPAPGSLWITARQATLGSVEYARLPPVLVAVAGIRDVDGLRWCQVIPFGISESDALAGEVVFHASDSPLGLPLRFAVNHRLCLHPEQLDRAVGQLGPQPRAELCAALAGAGSAQRRAADEAPAGRVDDGRRDPAVLMVLQRPWREASERLLD